MRAAACWLLLLSALAPSAWGREWTDHTGKHKVEAELVEFDDRLVVLKKEETGKLVAVPIEKLSKADREFLQSKPARKEVDEAHRKNRTWKLRDGTQAVGHVTAYGARDVTVVRRSGMVYVNDKPFGELSKQHQHFVLSIINDQESAALKTAKDLEAWAVKQKGQPRTFRCEGVIIETTDGEQLAAPFCVFSEEDLKVLQPGYEQWKAAEKDAERRDEQSLLVRSLASAYQRDRQIDRQIQMLDALSDWLDLWQVQIVVGGKQSTIVVPGRNSNEARAAALAKNPGAEVGAIRRLDKRR
jgi:hypothetical protein